MRTVVISLLTLPAVKLQDSYQNAQQNEDTLNDPWSDQEAKSWFLGGNNAERRHFNSDLPSVGQYNSDLPSQNGGNQRDENVASYESFPGFLLPSVPSSGSLERPQNMSSHPDGLASRQRGKNSKEEEQGSRILTDQDGGFLPAPNSGYISDPLARQNYWDPSFGNWPTHTELFPGELVTTLYKASWYTAKATCNALGAYLTEIDSPEEQQFIEDIKTKNHVALLWTGATDFSQNGYWTWNQSKRPVQAYQKWARPSGPWQRNVLGPVGRGSCMALRRGGVWDSFRCPNKFPYLCERNSSVSIITSSTPPTTTSTTTPTPAEETKGQCYSLTIEGASWIKLSSKLLTHPKEGRCHLRIVFSTFSNGLMLRKFDWNHESLTLAIVGGELVFKMATGRSQDISVSSSLLVTDGLEHTVIVSFGVGFISLQVDDDHVKTAEDRRQPGLAHDANVFLGGQPGGEYSGYSGCIDTFQVFISPTKYSAPVWSEALQVDFGARTSLTILYGSYQCGVCSMRTMQETHDTDQGEWGEVDELPRPMTTWMSPYQEPEQDSDSDGGETNRGYPETSYTRVVDDTWIVNSKPITVLDITPSSTQTTSSTSTAGSTTSTTTTTTTVTVKKVTTSRPLTTKTVLPSTTVKLVRKPCEAHQLSLDGSGWLELSRKLMPQKPNYRTVINLRFSSLQANSLILWQGDYRLQHYFAIALTGGFLEFRFNLGNDPTVIRSAKLVNDGSEHEVVIIREDNRGSVQVDGGLTIPGINSASQGTKMNIRRAPIFLGGAPEHSSFLPPEATLYKTPFRGCILGLEIFNNKVSLHQGSHKSFTLLFLQIVEDDSGLGGFGSEIDFTNDRMVHDRVNIECVQQC